MKNCIADKFCRDEVRKYRPDIEFLYDIALDNAVRLAMFYGADVNIVKIAVSMMDSKLPLAAKMRTFKEHINMAVDATLELLSKCFLSDDDKNNIINRFIYSG